MSDSPAPLLREFHVTFGLHEQAMPALPPAEVAVIRQRLLEEEVSELAEAARAGHLAEIARELADVVYVAYGTALAYGIDLDEVLAEVHKANMSRLDEGGRPVLRDDGKVAKSSRYRPPDVTAVLRRQGWTDQRAEQSPTR